MHKKSILTDFAFCCQEHTCNRRCVLKSHTRHLSRVDDSALEEVLIFAGACVVAIVALAVLDVLNDDGAFQTCVGNNLAQRLLDGTFYNLDTSVLIVVVAVEVLKSRNAAHVSHATARNDAFSHSRACCAQRVVYTVFLLLHLNL